MKRLGFKYIDLIVFVAGLLVIPVIFGRIIGDPLRVYVAYYLYMIGWLVVVCGYCAIARRKIRRFIPLFAIIAFLSLALPVWLLARWDRERLIYNAARYDHPVILRMLLAKGADQNEINQVLLDAAAGGNANIVEYSLARGANPNTRLYNGDSALMVATQSGSLPTVRLILKSGADVNARNKSGRTALIWAVYESAPEIAQLIIDAGADVNARDDKGETPLRLAYGFQNGELVRILKQSEARE